MVVENTSKKELIVDEINTSKPSKDFIVYEVEGIKKGDVFKKNETKKLVVTLKTVELNNFETDFEEALLTTINFEENIVNPLTSSKGLLLLLLIGAVVGGSTIVVYKKNKVVSYIVLTIMCFSVFSTANAKEKINLEIKINVFYESKEVSFNDKSAIFFGDSVAYGHLTNGNGFGYYINEMENFSNFANPAVSSATLNRETQGTNNIMEQMINNRSTSYDYVIIEGGFGDLRDEPPLGNITDGYVVSEFDTRTFAGAVEYTLYLATTIWENARIGFIISYDVPNNNQGVRPDHEATKEYWDIVKAACDKWNVDYLDFFEGSAMYNGEVKTYSELFDVTRNTYLEDSIHPNDAGYKMITPFIKDWMKTLPVYKRNFEVITSGNDDIEYPVPIGYSIVNDFNDLVFVKDQAPSSLGNGYGVIPNWSGATSIGRATAVKYLVKVEGGQTVGLSNVASNVSYAIGELDHNAIIINPSRTPGEGQYHGEWLNDNVTLNNKTKYIIVSFRNGDGSTSFTNSQLALLPTYIEIKK